MVHIMAFYFIQVFPNLVALIWVQSEVYPHHHAPMTTDFHILMVLATVHTTVCHLLLVFPNLEALSLDQSTLDLHHPHV